MPEKKSPSKRKKSKKIAEDSGDEDYFSGTELDENGEQPKLAMYMKYSRSDTVKDTGKTFLEMHLTKKEEAIYDVIWFDSNLQTPKIDRFIKGMQTYQRMNFFPGGSNLWKKIMIHRVLRQLRMIMPKTYDFFP